MKTLNLINADRQNSAQPEVLPLSLAWAVKEGNLQFIADRFQVQICKDGKKLLKDMTPWELLNLRPETVLNLGLDRVTDLLLIIRAITVSG